MPLLRHQEQRKYIIRPLSSSCHAVVDGYVSISPLDTSLSHKEHHAALSRHSDALTAGLTR